MCALVRGVGVPGGAVTAGQLREQAASAQSKRELSCKTMLHRDFIVPPFFCAHL